LDAAAAIHQWNGAEKRLGANCSGAKLGWQAKASQMRVVVMHNFIIANRNQF
jgi:hypothetical protein